MSETLIQKPLEKSAEQHPGAAEVFLSPEDLVRRAQEAIDNGVITTKLHTSEDPGYPDISKYHMLDAEDVSSEYINGDNKYISGSIDEVPVKDKRSLIDKVAKMTEEKVLERAFYDNNWYMNESFITREIEGDTPITQRYELELEGQKPIELINFTQTEISQDQLEQIRKVVSAVAATAGPAAFEATNAITFHAPDRFGSEIIAGSALGMSGAIKLNEKLINGEFDEIYTKFKDIGLTPLESTLTHEMAHLIELKDTVSEAYGKQTGWKKDNKDIVDDYGEVQQVFRDKLDTPWEIHLTGDTGMETVNALKSYELQEITSAKPVTGYGYTNSREDLAEAFVPFVHAKHDQGQLDRLRKDSLNLMMQRVNNAEHGPRLVTISPVELDRKIGDDIASRVYTVGEPVFSYAPPGELPKFKKIDEKEQAARAYRSVEVEVTDDYGNTVSASRRTPSKW